MQDSSLTPPWKSAIYRSVVVLTLAFGLLQLLALPLALTFDSHEYIDSADILGSPRFNQDWPKSRTPLLPLLLKGSIALLGRQPLAVLLVPWALGMIGILVGGVYLRQAAGELPAAAGMILASLFPTLISYQHIVLTEAGVVCFLSLILALLMWWPNYRGARWVQAVGLGVVLSAGYDFRQTLLPLAPLAAVLYTWGATRQLRQAPAGAVAKECGRLSWRTRLTVACQALVILALPATSVKIWQRYGDDNGFGDIVLSFTILQQALIPPDSPYLEEHAQAYRNAIDETLRTGNLYSGLRYDLFFPLYYNKLGGILRQKARTIFFDCVRHHPDRYLAGVARTAMLFGGARGQNSEAFLHMRGVMDPSVMGDRNSIGGNARNNHDFTQITSRSSLMTMLWKLRPRYRSLVIAGSIGAIVGLLIGLCWRVYSLVAICSVPIGYLVPYILILDCNDRYALPAQVMVILNLVAVVVLVSKTVRAYYLRRTTPNPCPVSEVSEALAKAA